MEEDYFNILSDDMLESYRTAQKRLARIDQGEMSPLPQNLLVGEAKGYFTSILCFDLVKFSDLTRTGEDNLNASVLLHTVIPTVLKVLSDFRGITVESTGDQLAAIFGLEARDAAGSAKAALQAARYTTPRAP